MNHYEREIAGRLEQHLLNGSADNAGDDSRSSPILENSSSGSNSSGSSSSSRSNSSSSNNSSGGGDRGNSDKGGDPATQMETPVAEANRSAAGGGAAKQHAR